MQVVAELQLCGLELFKDVEKVTENGAYTVLHRNKPENDVLFNTTQVLRLQYYPDDVHLVLPCDVTGTTDELEGN